MVSYGYGCIPDAPEHVAEDEAMRPLSALVRLAPSRRAKVSYRDRLDSVCDQGATSSCVGHALSTALYLAGQAQGQPIPRPSRRWLYDIARYRRRPGVLEDTGSSGYTMASAAAENGIVAETRFPFDPALINEPPPFDLDIAGADALFTDWFRASDDPEELALALDRGHVPIVAIPVHTNFEQWTSDEPYFELAGDFRGNHMLAVIGYDEHATHGLVFEVVNSWGPTWCRGGFVRLAGHFLRRRGFDRIVGRTVPVPR